MIDEALKEQASLYVAGALTAGEAREFEGAMNHSVELQLLVAEQRGVLDAMAAALPRRTPPPALKSRILRAVDARFAASAVPTPPAAGSGFWGLVPWAMAASLAFLCVFLAQRHRNDRLEWLQLQQSLAEAQMQQQAAERRLEEQRSEFQAQRDQTRTRILNQTAELQKQFATENSRLVERLKAIERHAADPAARPRTSPPVTTPGGDGTVAGGPAGGLAGGPGGIPLAPAGEAPTTFLGVLRSSGQAIGAVSWDALLQRGTLLVDQLAVPAEDKDYQLWLFVEGAPVSGGLVRVDANGKLQGTYLMQGRRIDLVQSFAISLERKGGALQPEGVIVATN